MRGMTHPFHLMGWNCTWSPHPIPSHPNFPSLSLFHTPKPHLECYAPGASCNSKTRRETIMLSSTAQSSHHGMLWVSSNFIKRWPSLLWLLWEQLLALSEPIKYFFLQSHALVLILWKALTKLYPSEDKNALGKLLPNLLQFWCVWNYEAAIGPITCWGTHLTCQALWQRDRKHFSSWGALRICSLVQAMDQLWVSHPAGFCGPQFRNHGTTAEK